MFGSVLDAKTHERSRMTWIYGSRVNGLTVTAHYPRCSTPQIQMNVMDCVCFCGSWPQSLKKINHDPVFKAGEKGNYVCEQLLAPALYIVCLNHNSQKHPETFWLSLFRRPLHHFCSTFPARQETAARDVSHPVAGDATLDEPNNRGGGRWRDDTAVRLRAFFL